MQLCKKHDWCEVWIHFTHAHGDEPWNRFLTTTHPPEQNEILQHGKGDEDTVQKAVKQEQDEELVVGEINAVVLERSGHVNHCRLSVTANVYSPPKDNDDLKGDLPLESRH